MSVYKLAAPIAGVVKKSTGITGLAVQPQARRILTGLYKKTLSELRFLPKDFIFRMRLEKLSEYRLRVVQQVEDIFEIEQIIGQGQVEELILDAEDELAAIPLHLEQETWKENKYDPCILLWKDRHGIPK